MDFKIEYFTDPYSHIIIHNAFPRRLCREFFEEALKLEPFYEQAKVGYDTLSPRHDGCKVCDVEELIRRNALRDNKVVYMDQQYKTRIHESVIVQGLHNQICNMGALKNIIIKYGGVFSLLEYINTSETILSWYGKCDFFGWHKDTFTAGEKSGTRIITVVYYFNKENAKFTGGELLLADPTFSVVKKITPENNMLVVFPSHQLHAVNSVNLDTAAFDEGRFSINFWLGYNNINKFQSHTNI